MIALKVGIGGDPDEPGGVSLEISLCRYGASDVVFGEVDLAEADLFSCEDRHDLIPESLRALFDRETGQSEGCLVLKEVEDRRLLLLARRILMMSHQSEIHHIRRLNAGCIELMDGEPLHACERKIAMRVIVEEAIESNKLSQKESPFIEEREESL